ncbi:MAG: SCP2 sterol-binding domain-containing protein [Betaproteobacteria bacterium]|jgi:predicted lipid carrier protein YhbT|nr:SCP2 sterol-binding domain-containing protein [Betaproteobacteria bacterium]MBP6319850.1 SCP2 sterol-binding domain-containing protein [Rubrivivax sp.]MBK7457386.1 SCP2 sterol-binding domain-containing protein [Betaproteobacteria bacterium]MBK8865400.1 SCP2 sterol-binding domain-containing protein [Betaproteobacteria bacterium]MBK9685030.1 SCP2 sterol-binding domain-containing protein [Betaproteobacteria bacterium]
MNSSAGHRPEVRPEFRPGSPPEAPWPLEAVARRLRDVVRRLPLAPPSFVAARVLDRLLWPRLDASQRTLLRHRCIEIESVETAVRVRLVLGERGFEVARAGLAPVVVIRAQTAALLRLARGEDDADRLFFERRLVMEGDTEFALLLKNTLDAIGPLWAPTPR